MNAITTTENLALTLASDIDSLYVLDQQAKALAEQVKTLKGELANKYGEGKHVGQSHSVEIKLVPMSGTVDYAALCVAYGITDAVLDTFRKEGRVDIRVTAKK